MKKLVEGIAIIFLVLTLGGSVVASGGPARAAEPDAAVREETEAFRNPGERLSYALGMILGSQFRDQSVDVDVDRYVQGLRAGLAGGETLLSDAEARAAVNELRRDLDRKKTAPPVAGPLSDIKVSFKLDPHLTRGIYMGDRWVSPPTYTSAVQKGESLALEARVRGVDAKGMPVRINPQWVPEDPDMVSVTPEEGNEVRITVKRAGESRLRVVSSEFSKDLSIKARYEDDTVQVEISQ